MRSRWCPALALLLGCLPGCGSPTGEVTGQVNLGGKPVCSGSVILYCPGKRIVRGVLGPDGTYTIPNVPIGDASVVVRVPPPGGPTEQDSPSACGPAPVGAPAGVPARYTVPEESGLTVRVGRGRVVYNIELEP